MEHTYRMDDLFTTSESEMVSRLIRNYDEDCGFADILDRFERKDFANIGSICVCKTPNVLAFGGAKLGLDLVITPTTILKCMSDPSEFEHGHNLDKDIFKYLIFELRNPVMLLRGSKEGTLVAVTDLMDREGRPIIVSVAMNRRKEWHYVNQITSAYGREDFNGYLQRQIDKGNLLAINRNKANQVLRSAGVQFPMEETLVSFDNSIAYSMDNVKIVTVGKSVEMEKNSGIDDTLANAKGRANAGRMQGSDMDFDMDP